MSEPRRAASPARRGAGHYLAPPALRAWWAGLPALTARDTAAYLLPTLLPLRAEDRLLTVGRSAGTLAAALDRRAPMRLGPVALEPGPSAANPAPLDVVHGDPGALPFGEGRFTVLLCGHQVRGWDDALLLRFLREAWRVLTHNGIVVVWEVAPSRSPRVNAIWRRLLAEPGREVRLRSFAQIGRIGREAGFAWLQTLPLRPFLWPPGPRLSVMMRKEHYDEQTIDLAPGATPEL